MILNLQKTNVKKQYNMNIFYDVTFGTSAGGSIHTSCRLAWSQTILSFTIIENLISKNYMRKIAIWIFPSYSRCYLSWISHLLYIYFVFKLFLSFLGLYLSIPISRFDRRILNYNFLTAYFIHFNFILLINYKTMWL